VRDASEEEASAASRAALCGPRPFYSPLIACPAWRSWPTEVREGSDSVANASVAKAQDAPQRRTGQERPDLGALGCRWCRRGNGYRLGLSADAARLERRDCFGNIRIQGRGRRQHVPNHFATLLQEHACDTGSEPWLHQSDKWVDACGEVVAAAGRHARGQQYRWRWRRAAYSHSLWSEATGEVCHECCSHGARVDSRATVAPVRDCHGLGARATPHPEAHDAPIWQWHRVAPHELNNISCISAGEA